MLSAVSLCALLLAALLLRAADAAAAAAAAANSSSTTLAPTAGSHATHHSNGTSALPKTSATPSNSTAEQMPAPQPLDVHNLPALAWIVTALFLAAIIFFNIVLVRYYSDRNETELFPFLVTVIALSVTQFAVVLIPLDVYLAGASTGNTNVVKMLYYILYGLTLLFSLVIVPFAYFYYEEDDEDVTVGDRTKGACKYTSFLIVILIVLLVVGFLMSSKGRPDVTGKVDDPTVVNAWIKAIFTDNPGIFIVSFGLSCLTLLGFLCVITYTAYGLAAMPIDLMKGRRDKGEEQSKIYQDLNVTREKKRAINAKYLSGKKRSKRDEKTLSLLSRQERVLSRQGERIEDQQKGLARVINVLRPFSFVFGALFFIVSLLLFVSLTWTQIMRVLHTFCHSGATCGYLLNLDKQTPNPLDRALSAMGGLKVFLDIVAFTLVILYLFFATLVGIVKIGIRVLWLTLFKLRRRSSPPQGLMLASIILVASLLALTQVLMTLAPQYISYGGQTYQGSEGGAKPCSPEAPEGFCHMSQVGIFMHMMSLQLPFFAIVFYWAQWVMVATTLFGCFFAIIRCKRSNVDARDSDSDEDEW